MNNKKLSIIKISSLSSFENRMACLKNVKVNIDNKIKTLLFFIDRVNLSIIKNESNLEEKLNEMILSTLESGINENFEFESVYYFEYTGSHFQEMDEKPEWAKN